MDDFMQDLLTATENRCNVEMLVGFTEHGHSIFGVRLRPWSNKTGKALMVLGAGGTPAIAMRTAVEKAADGRWEPLDFARRPWETAAPTGGWNV